MKTIGTWLAGIVVSAIVLGICALCGRFAEEDRIKHQANDTHRVKSNVTPFMINPVHKWHPANVNHVNRR